MMKINLSLVIEKFEKEIKIKELEKKLNEAKLLIDELRASENNVVNFEQLELAITRLIEAKAKVIELLEIFKKEEKLDDQLKKRIKMALILFNEINCYMKSSDFSL